MEERIAQLEAQIASLLEWKNARELQQIRYPLDEASRASLGTVTVDGLGGTALTQSINIASTPQSISVPRAYLDTILLNTGDVRYEVPYIAIV